MRFFTATLFGRRHCPSTVLQCSRRFHTRPGPPVNSHMRFVSPIPYKLVAKHKPKPFKLPPAVTTLDPLRIGPANYFDISKSPLRFHYRKLSTSQPPHPQARQFGNQMMTTSCAFPDDTRGFLYYHSPPSHSPFCGAIRFRLATDSHRANFLAGTDLLLPHGLPWQLSIWEVATSPFYKCLCDVLARDGFAPTYLIEACVLANVGRDSVTLRALKESWVVDWQWEASRVYIAAPNRRPVATLIKHPWYDKSSAFRSPYQGRGIVSIVESPKGEFALRVDRVLDLIEHTVNLRTVVPTAGHISPLRFREILKTTKKTTRCLNNLWRLPVLSPDHNILDVYRHHDNTRLSMD
ncbi:hypothetical protein C8J57DRAFT_1320512 [Mycena rebaudengoi]|nr:hypothetical protein C8J57DRAFT_1320512 [Mycena rebaudengoi]